VNIKHKIKSNLDANVIQTTFNQISALNLGVAELFACKVT